MATQGWRSIAVDPHQESSLLGRQFLRLNREHRAYRWAYRGQDAASPKVGILWVINLELAGTAGMERDETGEWRDQGVDAWLLSC